MQQNSFWAGGERLCSQCSWGWISFEKWSYTEWAENEPNNSGEKCLEVGFIGHQPHQWNDQDCWRERFFVCEKEPTKEFIRQEHPIIQNSQKSISVSWSSNETIEYKNKTSLMSIKLQKVISNIPSVTVDCLFSGKLEGDNSSLVTVSGCKEEKETTISIASMLVPNGLIDIAKDNVNDTSVVLTDLLQTKRRKRSLEEQSYLDVLEPPVYFKQNSHGKEGNSTHEPENSDQWYSGPLPKMVKLETTLYYDKSLLDKFDGDKRKAKQWLSRVIELAKTRFAEPSLKVKIKLIVKIARYIPQRLKANEDSIREIGKLAINPNSLNSFFCFDTSDDTIGIAWRGTTCRTDGYAFNINEFWTEEQSALNAARVFAHELGHNLGMRYVC